MGQSSLSTGLNKSLLYIVSSCLSFYPRVLQSSNQDTFNSISLASSSSDHISSLPNSFSINNLAPLLGLLTYTGTVVDPLIHKSTQKDRIDDCLS